MKSYIGIRSDKGGYTVTVLDDNHPDESYLLPCDSSNSAELSRALLIDVLDDVEKAHRLYREFMVKLVSHFKADRWDLSDNDIRVIASTIEAGKKQIKF